MKSFFSMVIRACLVFGILFSGTAMANSDLNGTWQGVGTATDDLGQTGPCGRVEIEIVVTPQEIRLPNGLDNCRLISTFIDPAIFEIRGSELWYRNQKVGLIEKNRMVVAYRNLELGSGLGFDELLEVGFSEGHLYYRDSIHLIDEQGHLQVKATLNKFAENSP